MQHSQLAAVAVALAALAVPPGFAAAQPAPTAAGAARFVREAEAELFEAWKNAERANWVQANFITADTEAIAAGALEELLATTARLAKEASKFRGLELPADDARKLRLMTLSLPLAAPADPAKQAELAAITTSMSSEYGRGKYCPEGSAGKCLSLGELEDILAESRDPAKLLEAWAGWHAIAKPIRPQYARFAELANEGARELGFADLGAMWRSGYDMPPDQFAAEMDRLWEQVRPLYESLHCYVRGELSARYGAGVVPADGPIPAHLLGNMWAQSWGNVHDLVMPESARGGGVDVTALLRQRTMTPVDMVKTGEKFFTSLGFESLPETFWSRSLFVKPADRDVVCHASAWNLDWKDDLRIKMCIDVDAEDFSTIHHELGHNFYQRAYNDLSPLFQNGAHDGFHEGIGDTLALSITPAYLARIGLLQTEPKAAGDLDLLMRMALDKVAFLPFGLLVDKWRWQVFSGDVTPAEYNSAWWSLRERYQGVAPPVARTAADFDAGAKYHVPANTPYARYFLAHILQFQFHEALCREAGWTGPLHRCSIYGNAAAGAKLQAMMEMGQSRPWPDAMQAITGERRMDASALLEYFAPLRAWLDERNANRTCGW